MKGGEGMEGEEKRGSMLTAVLCFVMVFTGLGFVSSPRSLYVVPVTEALEIERSLYSFVDSLRYVATAVVNLFFGALVVRFGARRLIGVIPCARGRPSRGRHPGRSRSARRLPE